VGKSSLFNRILGKDKAIVDKVSGITRDRLSGDVEWGKVRFRLIDTGGFEYATKQRIAGLVIKQLKKAIEEADLILFICDVLSGPLPLDKEIARLLRKNNKRVLLVINKVDGGKRSEDVYAFYSLGLGEPNPVSALHGRGIGDLLECLERGLLSGIGDIVCSAPVRPTMAGRRGGSGSHPAMGAAKVEELSVKEPGAEKIRVAIVGRPNVGKSSFLNRILNEERVIVDSVPGTTRDSIDTYFSLGDKEFTLIDTAGIRRKRKVKETVGVYGMARAVRSINHCDVGLVLIDGDEGLTIDDLRVLKKVISEYKGCLLAVNKWDKIKEISAGSYEEHLRKKIKFAGYVPILFTSALTGRNVIKALKTAAFIEKNRMRIIPTGKLNKVLKDACEENSPPMCRGKRQKLYYVTQTGVRPPAFLIFTNTSFSIRKNYVSYLENKFRERFNFTGTPIKLEFRKKTQ